MASSPRSIQRLTRDQVHQKLIALGAASSDARRYSQREKIDALNATEYATTHKTVLQQVGKGYCEGLTLDWIRRVLLPKETPKVTFEGTKPERDLRHAKVQAEFQDKTKQAAHMDNWDTELRRQYAAATSDEERAILRKANDEWCEKSTVQSMWWSFSKTLDADIAEQRLEAGKAGGPNRGFSRLDVVAGNNPTLYTAGIWEFVTKVLTDSEFKTNRAAQLVLSQPSSGGSHAIAIWRMNTSIFILFDPNLGTYGFRLASELRAALEYIFKTAYPNMEGAGDAHIYEVGGQIRGRFSIFEGRATPVPGPDQLLPPAQ